MKVWLLSDSDERVVAVHASEESAELHRANFVVPSWITIEAWDVEDFTAKAT